MANQLNGDCEDNSETEYVLAVEKWDTQLSCASVALGLVMNHQLGQLLPTLRTYPIPCPGEQWHSFSRYLFRVNLRAHSRGALGFR